MRAINRSQDRFAWWLYENGEDEEHGTKEQRVFALNRGYSYYQSEQNFDFIVTTLCPSVWI